MPDIAGRGIVNPVAMIGAVTRMLREGPRTRNLGGAASTTEMGQAIAALI